MIRINKDTVHFTQGESVVREVFEGRLDEGMSIADAAMSALNGMSVPTKIGYGIGPAFVHYLSEGTVKLDTWLNAVPAVAYSPEESCALAADVLLTHDNSLANRGATS